MKSSMVKRIFLAAIILVFIYSFLHIPSPKPSNVPSVPSSETQPTRGSTLPFELSVDPQFHLGLFASNLGNPRDLQFTPGGTLLVSNPNANSVFALPDANHDGIADSNKVIITGENHVHGLAFYNNYLFIADVDKVVRYKWDETTLTATRDKVLFSLPQNSDHNARTIVFDSQGQMLVSVGSTCNVCKESSPESATIMVSDQNGTNPHIFASGLRNAPFMAFNPTTHDLWSTEMGRDNLGDAIPSDELDIIKEGSNYGWPYCYDNKVHDTSFDPSNLHSCSNTISPIFKIPAHSAPLGLTFVNSTQFPANWQGDLLVAYHGSWNRTTPTGYKVVHLKLNGNSAIQAEDFITGFLPAGALIGPTSALGRPVDLTFDQAGNLYLSDDKAGNVYILTKN